MAKFNIGMICAYLKMNTSELAEAADIDFNHLAAVRAGRVKMSADDLIALSDASGIDVRQIETDPSKQ